MKDCFVCMALGFIAGALVVSSNNEAQRIVEKGKKAAKVLLESIKEVS